MSKISSKNEISNALADYGLSEKEAKIYLALVQLGQATIKKLAEATKIKRTSIYPLTDKMITKGIIGEYKAKYGTHFIATSPNALSQRLDKVKTNFQAIIPQLEALEKKAFNEPTVKYFKGKEGYYTILGESLEKSGGEILYWGSSDKLNEIISKKYVTDKYIPERLKKRIHFKQLIVKDSFGLEQKETDGQNLRVTKFLPEGTSFDSSLIIYGDKIAYLSSKQELTAVLIESPDIAQMEREKFYILWEKL
jgi:HTH-type transcriptional regulator, sugar sensing transcriptional regulator